MHVILRAALIRFRLAIIMLCATLAYGTLGFMAIEEWNYLDSFYMTVTTLTTVGYSEVHPLSEVGRAFTITLILSGVAVFFVVVGELTQALASGEITRFWRTYRLQRTIDTYRDHYVICAFGRVGRASMRELETQGEKMVLVEQLEELRPLMESSGHPFLIADPSEEEVLKQAGIERAKGLICAVDNDAVNVYITLTARSLNPNLSIVARASKPGSEEKLVMAGADRVVSPYALSGQRMGALAAHPSVVEFFDMVTIAPDLRIEELEVAPGAPLDGLTAGACGRAFPGLQVLALKKPNGKLVVSPDPGVPIGAGDLVVVLGPIGELREMNG